MEKIWTTVVDQHLSMQIGGEGGRFGQIRTLRLTGYFSETGNLMPYQFAIHGSSKEKEKQLVKQPYFDN